MSEARCERVRDYRASLLRRFRWRNVPLCSLTGLAWAAAVAVALVCGTCTCLRHVLVPDERGLSECLWLREFVLF